MSNAPSAVALEDYQSNDPTCPIAEGDLPGPRSALLLREWIAFQKAKEAAKAKEAEARQVVRAVWIVEVVKRQEDDVRAAAVKAHEAIDIE